MLQIQICRGSFGVFTYGLCIVSSSELLFLLGWQWLQGAITKKSLNYWNFLKTATKLWNPGATSGCSNAAPAHTQCMSIIGWHLAREPGSSRFIFNVCKAFEWINEGIYTKIGRANKNHILTYLKIQHTSAINLPQQNLKVDKLY